MEKKINDQIAGPSPLNDHGLLRKQALKTWINEEKALSWGNKKAQAAELTIANYDSLLRLLAEHPTDKSLGLIKSEEQWTYLRMAKRMVELGVNGYAPAPKHGFFQSALPLAYQEIKKYSPDPEKANEFVLDIIAAQMQEMDIHFVPWFPSSPSNRAKDKNRLAHHNHWVFLDHSCSQSPFPDANATGVLSPSSRFTRTAAQDAAADPCASWKIPDSIQDMGPLWQKKTLPLDWSTSNAYLHQLARTPKSEYIHQTYEYFQRVYDGTNWKHHLSVVLAILVTAILPNVFVPSGALTRTDFSLLTGQAAVTSAVRELPWAGPPSANRKGCHDKKTYFTMLSTAILGLLDKKAPLRLYLEKYNKLGDPWTEKHGKYLWL